MFTRPEFDHELLARLPGAKPTRKERADGWEDTLRINILTISIRVWTKGSGRGFARKTSGTVRAEIRSVRVAVDGSETLTWASQDRHHQGLVLVLDALKVQLNTVAAGLTHLCGIWQEEDGTPGLGPPGKPESDLDGEFDEFFR